MKLIGRLCCVLIVFLLVAQRAPAQVVNSEWNTGSGNWNVLGNWSPADVPDNGGGFTYHVQIGNRPVAANAAVTFIPEDGSSDTITSLAISGGADLFTNGNQLLVTGQTTLSGSISTLRVDPHSLGVAVFALDTDDLDIESAAVLAMNGGTASIDVLLEVNAGGAISGFGHVIVGDADGTVETALENSGTIQVANGNVPTLRLVADAVDVIDLDGTSEAGVVDAATAVADATLDSVTFLMDAPFADAFSGVLQIGQRDTATFNFDFTMDGAEVQMDGGSFTATFNGPADITSIANSAFTITNAAVIANDLTFTGTANTITLNNGGSLTLAGTVNIPDASAFVFSGAPTLVVSGTTTISEAGADFNWDGAGAVTTTVSGNGFLNLSVDQVDTGNDTFDGVINLNDHGDLTVNVTATSWTMAGTLNKNGSGVSGLSGDAVNITDTVNVNGGTLDVNATATLASGSNFNVAAGANADLPTTTLAAGSNLNISGMVSLGGNSVLSGPATLAGTGLFRLNSTSTVSANTTVNTTSFDWDGTGSGSAHTINDGVVFTVNSTTHDPDDSGDIDDPISLGGNGAQIVMNGVTTWTLTRILTTNTAAAGLATIGGTAHLILSGASAGLNVSGPTTVSAPITFGASSTTTIAAAGVLTLNGAATYAGGAITGAGNFQPSSGDNIVTANTTISSTNFDFDRGDWEVQSGATLTINVSDSESDAATDIFDANIQVAGTVNVNTGASAFLFRGFLYFGANGTWSGEPLAFGNDSSNLARMTLFQGSHGTITAPVTFTSDSAVEIESFASLHLTNTVDFNSVNAAHNADFEGSGTLTFSGPVNVNETTTINMDFGTVDLDGTDPVGDTINIKAPFTLNVATLSSFGRTNSAGGVNTLEVDNLGAETGVLSVNLFSPFAEWTLNAQGVLNLVNDNTEATLLSGSPVNLNGTLNVTGDVRVDARLDLGATATVTLNTAGEPLRLSGGTLAEPNTISGATIGGAGQLGADSDTALHGSGTLNSAIAFSGNSALRAAGGTLNVNGTILDVGTIGTADSASILNVPNAWNSSAAENVNLSGGELRGGQLTIGNPNGLTGSGLVTARVINNARIAQTGAGGTLVVETAGNDNDWDGTSNNGTLAALGPGGTLELRDDGADIFRGTVTAQNATIITNGFGLNFDSGSTVNLTAGELVSTAGWTIAGAVNVGAGASSIESGTNFILWFMPSSVTTLNGELWVRCNNTLVDPGATFSGTGTLGVADVAGLAPANGAIINALIVNHGDFRPGGFNTVGRVDGKDYQQSATGEIQVDFAGTGLAQYDRFIVGGAVQLAGTLRTQFLSGFVPSLGNTFNIISASAGVLGTFDHAPKPAPFPDNRRFKITYTATLVQLTVVEDTYEPWINSFPFVALADRDKRDDPDGDGLNNFTEFALDGHPGRGSTGGKFVAKIAPVAGQNAFTLTFPVRNGAVPAASDPAGGPLVLEQTTDAVAYSVQASDELSNWTLEVTEVTGADATNIQTGLPALSAGWTYRTFRSPGPVAGDPKEFLRVEITELP